jgi:hypothetical protein
MLRSFAVKSAISIAAGASIFLFAPTTMHAVATPGAAATVQPDLDPPWMFIGDTYPDTPAGLSDCQTEGLLLVTHSMGKTLAYDCILGSPDAGVYNLWLDPIGH